MLKFRLWGTEWACSLLFPATVVVLLTLDTGGMAGWCLAASVMHEAGHFLMLLACGGRPAQVSIGIFGVRVEQDVHAPIGYGKNVWVSLAGPLVNGLSCGILLLLGGGWTTPVMVHATMAVMNLLPVEPLDGGQALFCLLAPHMEEPKATRAVLVVSVVTILPLAAAGFYVLLHSGYNFTLLAVSVYLVLLLLLKKK